jgi:hypothetical protein
MNRRQFRNYAPSHPVYSSLSMPDFAEGIVALVARRPSTRVPRPGTIDLTRAPPPNPCSREQRITGAVNLATTKMPDKGPQAIVSKQAMG